MKNSISVSGRVLRAPAVLFFLILEFSFVSAVFCSEKSLVPQPFPAFLPGEILQYEVSWSKMVAGSVVMTVQREELENGKRVFSFVLAGKSSGLVDRLYPINDVIRSLYDPENMRSLSYTSASFGKRKRHSSLTFHPDGNTVVYRLNNDAPKTLPVPSHAQDRLAALYYLRSVRDYTVGSMFKIDVHEGGKNWTVEVHTLGRERINIDAGEFRTIKVKIRPFHQGVFQDKGVVYLWLTDDEQKVPVLLKNRSRKGDFLFKLTGMKPGTG